MSVFNQSRKNVIRFILISMFLIIITGYCLSRLLPVNIKYWLKTRYLQESDISRSWDRVRSKSQGDTSEYHYLWPDGKIPAKIKGTDTQPHFCKYPADRYSRIQEKDHHGYYKNKSYRPSVLKHCWEEKWQNWMRICFCFALVITSRKGL